jgi:hypothetical protein
VYLKVTSQAIVLFIRYHLLKVLKYSYPIYAKKYKLKILKSSHPQVLHWYHDNILFLKQLYIYISMPFILSFHFLHKLATSIYIYKYILRIVSLIAEGSKFNIDTMSIVNNASYYTTDQLVEILKRKFSSTQSHQIYNRKSIYKNRRQHSN